MAVPKEERFGSVRSEMIGNIKTSLASRWAEIFYFDGDLSTGPVADVENATTIAAEMVLDYSMGSFVGVSANSLGEAPDGMKAEVYGLLEETYLELEEFMYMHRDQVEIVAHLLNEHGTVDGAEVHALIDRLSTPW